MLQSAKKKKKKKKKTISCLYLSYRDRYSSPRYVTDRSILQVWSHEKDELQIETFWSITDITSVDLQIGKKDRRRREYVSDFSRYTSYSWVEIIRNFRPTFETNAWSRLFTWKLEGIRWERRQDYRSKKSKLRT